MLLHYKKEKSDRVEMVLKAAEEFLGVKYLKAEEIHSMLKLNNDGGVSEERVVL